MLAGVLLVGRSLLFPLAAVVALVQVGGCKGIVRMCPCRLRYVHVLGYLFVLIPAAVSWQAWRDSGSAFQWGTFVFAAASVPMHATNLYILRLWSG